MRITTNVGFSLSCRFSVVITTSVLWDMERKWCVYLIVKSKSLLLMHSLVVCIMGYLDITQELVSTKKRSIIISFSIQNGKRMMMMLAAYQFYFHLHLLSLKRFSFVMTGNLLKMHVSRLQLEVTQIKDIYIFVSKK